MAKRGKRSADPADVNEAAPGEEVVDIEPGVEGEPEPEPEQPVVEPDPEPEPEVIPVEQAMTDQVQANADDHRRVRGQRVRGQHHMDHKSRRDG